MKAFSAKLKHIYGPNLPASPKMGRGFRTFGSNPSAVHLTPLLESATAWRYLQSSKRSWRRLHEEPKLKTLLVQSGFRERSQDLTYVNYHLSPQTPTLRIPHQSPLFTDQASDLRHLQRLFSLPSPASFQVWQIQLLAQSISSFWSWRPVPWFRSLLPQPVKIASPTSFQYFSI